MKFEDILLRMKFEFSEIKKFPTLLNQNLDVFSMDNFLSDGLDIDEE